jgi:hypothetical protein
VKGNGTGTDLHSFLSDSRRFSAGFLSGPAFFCGKSGQKRSEAVKSREKQAFGAAVQRWEAISRQ